MPTSTLDRAPDRALDATLDAEGVDRVAVAEVALRHQTSDEGALGLGKEAARVGHRARARVRGSRGCGDDGDRRDRAGEKEPHARRYAAGFARCHVPSPAGRLAVAGRANRRRQAAWTREGLEHATGLDAAAAQARLSGTST